MTRVTLDRVPPNTVAVTVTGVTGPNVATQANIGESVIITGTGFLAGQSVTIGAQPVSNPTFDSATQITATVPAGVALDSLATVGVAGELLTNAILISSEPFYSAASHTNMVSVAGVGALEDFESYANTTALTDWYIEHVDRGTVTLDDTSTGGLAHTGTKAYRATYTAYTPPPRLDADVSIERALVNTSDTIRNHYITYWVYVPTGYDYVSDNPGGDGCKWVVAQRNTSWTDGRYSFHAITGSVETPTIYGVPSGIYWNMGFASTTVANWGAANTKPTVGGVGADYVAVQHLNLTTKRPGDIADNAWHRITYHVRHETTLDAGDGLARMWVDGYRTIDYDGEDSGNAAYQQVYTRNLIALKKLLGFPGIYNKSSPVEQFLVYDELRIFRNTSEA